MYLIVSQLKPPTMTKTFLFVLALLFMQLLGAQTIPNADFELWDNQPVPLYWQTNSRPLTLPPYDPYVVKKDTLRYSGSYAANLYANNVFKAYAKTTFPITTRPSALSLYYTLSFAPCVNDPGYQQQDTASVLVELLRGSNVVDQGYWESTASSFTYSQLIVPISHQATSFDSCRITLMGGRVNGGCGIVAAPTEFRVDHLSLIDSSATTCTDTGVVVPGAECPLIYDFTTGTLLHPCTMPAGTSLQVGDTIMYSYSQTTCVSICMQGTDVILSCYQLLSNPHIPAHPCQAYFNFSKHVDTVTFYDLSTADSITSYHWDFGDGSSATTANPIHIYARDSSYTVCLQIAGRDPQGNPCASTFCDTILITHDCIDSSLICTIPGGLCCDLSPPDTVCGCDSVTYYNGCYATYLYGVTSYYHGPCVSTRTGIHDADAVTPITLSPVPAHDALLLSYQLTHSGPTTLRILNTIGQELRSADYGYQDPGRHKTQLDLTGLSPGIYLLEIRSGTYSKVLRFVKE